MPVIILGESRWLCGHIILVILALKAEANPGYIARLYQTNKKVPKPNKQKPPCAKYHFFPNMLQYVTVLRGLKTLYEGPTSAIKGFTLKIPDKNFTGQFIDFNCVHSVSTVQRIREFGNYILFVWTSLLLVFPSGYEFRQLTSVISSPGEIRYFHNSCWPNEYAFLSFRCGSSYTAGICMC